MPKNKNKKSAITSKSAGGATMEVRRSANSSEDNSAGSSPQIKIKIDESTQAKIRAQVQGNSQREQQPPAVPNDNSAKLESSAIHMAGALLGLMPSGIAEDSQKQSNSLLELGEHVHTMKRPAINERLKLNLHDFWKVHGIDFALFWLMKPAEEQVRQR